MIVQENINFERGIDPKDAMDIGLPAVRAASRMIPGILYTTRMPKWGYTWWYKDPKNNKIYRAFTLKRDGGYRVKLADIQDEFPLDLKPTGKHFDKFMAKVNKIEESQNFERGIDSKDSIGIGRKYIWNMTANDMAEHILNVVSDKVRPILNKIEAAVKKAGYKDIETYQEYVYLRFDEDDEFPFVSKEIDDAEQELEETITAEVENFPIRDEKAKKDLIGDLFTLELEGGPHKTYVEMVKQKLDLTYIKESINFERGKDPKDTMDIGTYRTDAPKISIFKRMHQLAEMCPIFKEVTEIDWDNKEPKFIIFSTKTHKKTPSIFKETFTLYLTKEEELGIILFDDIEDTEYENISLDEFLKITSCKPIKESQNFERNQDVKKSMDVGLRNKYGKFYDLFEICHNLSTNSENFTYVSNIVFDKGEQPFFNIESVFFYTDDDNNKIPEGFVITLWPEEILCLNTVTKDEDTIKTEAKFIKITTCWDEDDNGGWMYES